MTTAIHHDTAPAPQNLFGICARIGQDFGFDPLWLRLGFASALILSPVTVIGAYFALGAIVLTSRLLFPARAATPAPALPLALPLRDGGEAAPSLPLAA